MPELLQQWYDACRATAAYREALDNLERVLERKVRLGESADLYGALQDEMRKRQGLLQFSSLGRVWLNYGDSQTLADYIAQRGEVDDFERNDFCVQRLLIEVVEERMRQCGERSGLMRIVEEEPVDAEAIKEANARLAQSNTIFKSTVNLYALRQLMEEHFVQHVDQKNKWVVLWVFCLNHRLLLAEHQSDKDFASQMAHADWFGSLDAKVRPSYDALANYGWLKFISVKQWTDKDKYVTMAKGRKNNPATVQEMQCLYEKFEEAFLKQQR